MLSVGARVGTKYRSLQAGRAVASLLVVVHHAAYFISVPVHLWHRTKIFPIFSGLKLGVEFFFVLSGIVILLAHERDLGHVVALPSFAWKRFRRIYPVYWIAFAAFLPLYLHSTSLNSYLVEPATLISNVALVHLGNLVTMLVVSWTLFQEIVFYSFFGIAIAHRRVGFTLLGGWFALSCSMTFLHASPLLSNYVFAPINLLFGFGMVSMLIVRRFRVRAPELWFSAGLLLFGLCIAASVRFGPTQPIIVQLSGLGAAAALVGAMRLEELSKLTVSNTLAFLGDASYSIYLVHFPVMIVLARLLFSASRSHHVPLAFCAVALCFSGIVVGCAMHLFIERPLLRWMGGFRHPWLSNQRATQTAT